jgi:hypothetical protein
MISSVKKTINFSRPGMSRILWIAGNVNAPNALKKYKRTPILLSKKHVKRRGCGEQEPIEFPRYAN